MNVLIRIMSCFRFIKCIRSVCQFTQLVSLPVSIFNYLLQKYASLKCNCSWNMFSLTRHYSIIIVRCVLESLCHKQTNEKPTINEIHPEFHKWMNVTLIISKLSSLSIQISCLNQLCHLWSYDKWITLAMLFIVLFSVFFFFFFFVTFLFSFFILQDFVMTSSTWWWCYCSCNCICSWWVMFWITNHEK